MAETLPPELPFETLCRNHSLELPAIAAARIDSDAIRERLAQGLNDRGIRLDEDLSLIVFGSLARREWTIGSDVDWTLLVDGPANSEHFSLAAKIGETIEALKLAKPGDTGTFGTLASSHDLVHHIGGLDDTNRNMTRRLLLLLESHAIQNEIVRSRVIRAVLSRYIVWGRGLPEPNGPRFRAPRFLLNDMVRYWRTVAVDYAAKKWEQGDKKWAIRNAKLRVSRKMTFVKGLLLCFDCEAFGDCPPWSDQPTDDSAIESQLVTGCEQLVDQTPVDLLSRAYGLVDPSAAAAIIRALNAYHDFLAFLNNNDNRQRLERLEFESADTDDVFLRVRHEIGSTFGKSLEDIFFLEEHLSPLTRKYGLF